MAHDIPQEITDMIIDFLHEDGPSLRACALVSRSWLPSSRFHLFRSSTIEDPDQFSIAFHTISTSRDVGTYVQELTIVGEGIYGFTFGKFEALLCGLPCLRRLRLQKVTFEKKWDAGHVRPGYRSTAGRPNNASLPRDTQQQHAGLFALEELQLLECDATTADYTHLFRLLGLFVSIQTLFLASNSKARQVHAAGGLTSWALKQVHVAVQHLHTFDVPFPIIDTLLTTLRASNSDVLRTFWYDDNVLQWIEGPGSTIGKFGTMVASLTPSHPHLQCLILGPLPIFEDPLWFERGAVVHLQLASLHGLRLFHLRGRWLERHLACVFTALPDSVREARFIVVGVSAASGQGSRNRFREFALAFEHTLRQRTQMTFVLDLGIAKRKIPEETFGLLRDRADKGLVKLEMLGRLLIDDSPKER